MPDLILRVYPELSEIQKPVAALYNDGPGIVGVMTVGSVAGKILKSGTSLLFNEEPKLQNSKYNCGT